MHVPPALRSSQSLVSSKSPFIAMPISTGAVPPFCTVMVLLGLVVFTACCPKLKDVEVTDIDGAPATPGVQVGGAERLAAVMKMVLSLVAKLTLDKGDIGHFSNVGNSRSCRNSSAYY
jgi:hypothetical protein